MSLTVSFCDLTPERAARLLTYAERLYESGYVVQVLTAPLAQDAPARKTRKQVPKQPKLRNKEA